MCLLYHIVRWKVNRIYVDFLLIVLTLGELSSVFTAWMERPVLFYQSQKQIAGLIRKLHHKLFDDVVVKIKQKSKIS